MILFVDVKLPRDLLSTTQLLPKSLEVSSGRRKIHVPVDVQAVPIGRKQVGTVRAGDRARITNANERATLSALFDGPSGLSAAISGHAAEVNDLFSVRLGNGVTVPLGQVAVSIDNETIDAARIDNINPSNEPYLSMPNTGIRDLAKNDVGVVLTLHLVGGDVSSSVEGVDMMASFGQLTMLGLIKLEDLVTIAGDSGAPVLDYKKQLVGFVVGSAGGRTYLIPARKVFDALQ